MKPCWHNLSPSHFLFVRNTRQASSIVGKTARKGVIHRKKAARLQSRLRLRANRATAGDLRGVSDERIQTELRKTMAEGREPRARRLLGEAGLLKLL